MFHKAIAAAAALACAFALPASAGAFDSERALETVRKFLADGPTACASLAAAVNVLARKEAQNGRMIERLVPKRNRYPKVKE